MLISLQCQVSIKATNLLCANVSYDRCVRPVVEKFEQSMVTNYGNNLTVEANQTVSKQHKYTRRLNFFFLFEHLKVATIGVQVRQVLSGPPSDADIQFLVNILLKLMRARVTGGRVYTNVVNVDVQLLSRKRTASPQMVNCFLIVLTIMIDVSYRCWCSILILLLWPMIMPRQLLCWKK